MDRYLELVRQAKHGNTDAFASLYQEVYEDLYRFAVYILKDPADAQDAVSETVMDAFAQLCSGGEFLRLRPSDARHDNRWLRRQGVPKRLYIYMLTS